MANKNFELRFAVGDSPAQTSSIWRIWGNDPHLIGDAKSDVYFSYRHVAGEIKISFHESGHVNYSFTRDSKYAKKFNLEDNFRHIESWVMDYRSPLFRILVPSSQVVRGLGNYHKDTKLIPVAEEGYATDIFIYITKGRLPTAPDGYSVFFEKELANHCFLTIVWRFEFVTVENENTIRNSVAKISKLIKASRKPNSDLRGWIFIDYPGGHGFIDLTL